ncbi:MAG: hypothetical protein LBS17_04430 [Actinomycetes bacterium]|jgi:uncharacterized repeat protein (TIGR02543 family)|nr:hypothetical protein [Actinomycetes bacterium]
MNTTSPLLNPRKILHARKAMRAVALMLCAALSVTLLPVIPSTHSNTAQAATLDPDITEGEIYYQKPDTGIGDDVISREETGFGVLQTADPSIVGTKTATDLDASDQTTVRLSVSAGATTTPGYSIVVVGDMSSSFYANRTAVQTLMNDLADDLIAKDVPVKIGVVSLGTLSQSAGTSPFSGEYAESTRELLALTPLTAANKATLYNTVNTRATTYNSNAVTQNLYGSLGMSGVTNAVAGTNIQAGIQAGRAMLNADTDTVNYPKSNRILLLMTDGGAFMWNGTNSYTQPLNQYSKYYNKSGTLTAMANGDAQLDTNATMWSGTSPRQAFYKLSYMPTDTVSFTDKGTAYSYPDVASFWTGFFYPHRNDYTPANSFTWWKSAWGPVPGDTTANNTNGFPEKSQIEQMRTRLYAYYHSSNLAQWYQNFMDGEAATIETVYPASELTFSEFHTRKPTSAAGNVTGIVGSVYTAATNPYMAIEKGTYWAAKELADINSSGDANVVTVGFENYNPSTKLTHGAQVATWKANQPLVDIPLSFLRWTDTVGDYYGLDYFGTGSGLTTPLTQTMDKITKSLVSTVEAAEINDTIGPDFSLVSTASIQLELAGTRLDKHPLADNRWGFDSPALPATPGGYTTHSGQTTDYPYVVSYTPTSTVNDAQLQVSVNTPLTSGIELALVYDLRLERRDAPFGWHDDVALNVQATLDYWSTGDIGAGGPATGHEIYPVPMTRYRVNPRVYYHFVTTPDGANLAPQQLVDIPAQAALTDPSRVPTLTVVPAGAPILGNAASMTATTTVTITVDGDTQVFTFQGWVYYDAATDSYLPFDFDTEINRDWHLYATWDPPLYTVTFDANGGVFAPGFGAVNGQVERLVLGPDMDNASQMIFNTLENWDSLGTTASPHNVWPQVTSADLKRTGYHLVSLTGTSAATWWSTSADHATTAGNLLFANTEIKHNWMVYAQWEPNRYTVYFRDAAASGGALYSALTVNPLYWTDSFSFPVPPAKTGYTFAGWQALSIGTTVTPADVTVYTATGAPRRYALAAEGHDELDSVTYVALWTKDPDPPVVPPSNPTTPTTPTTPVAPVVTPTTPKPAPTPQPTKPQKLPDAGQAAVWFAPIVLALAAGCALFVARMRRRRTT